MCHEGNGWEGERLVPEGPKKGFVTFEPGPKDETEGGLTSKAPMFCIHKRRNDGICVACQGKPRV